MSCIFCAPVGLAGPPVTGPVVKLLCRVHRVDHLILLPLQTLAARLTGGEYIGREQYGRIAAELYGVIERVQEEFPELVTIPEPPAADAAASEGTCRADTTLGGGVGAGGLPPSTGALIDQEGATS